MWPFTRRSRDQFVSMIQPWLDETFTRVMDVLQPGRTSTCCEKYQVSYGEQFWQSFQSRPHTEEALAEPAALELMSQSYSRVYHVVERRALSRQRGVMR